LEAVGKSDYFFLIVVYSPFTRREQEVKLLFKKNFSVREIGLISGLFVSL